MDVTSVSVRTRGPASSECQGEVRRGESFFYLEKSSSSATVNDYVNRSRRNVAFVFGPPPPHTLSRTSHAHLPFTSTPRRTSSSWHRRPSLRQLTDQVFLLLIPFSLYSFFKVLPLRHPSYHDLLLLLRPTISDNIFIMKTFCFAASVCRGSPRQTAPWTQRLTVRVSPYIARVVDTSH